MSIFVIKPKEPLKMENTELNFDNQPAGFIMPSNPADQKHIMSVMLEVSGSKTRASAERDYQREAIKELSKKHNIPAKLLTQFASSYHKSSFQEDLGVNADFEMLVNVLTKPQSA